MSPDNRANTYVEMLTEIHALANDVIPESVMIDFEQGMIAAWEQLFPLAPIKGCLFHLSKSIYRKVQSEGLAERYMNDEEFRQNIRMLSALSFVPVDDTIVAFEQLANHCGDTEQIILDYIETNYIGELRRGRRLPPRFQHAMWNMNIRVLDQLPRTNNNLEGWHNRFSGSLGNHPDIWKFINALKQDSVLNHHAMAQALIGAQGPAQRPIYRQINERINNLVENYRNDVINFLRGISYNLA